MLIQSVVFDKNANKRRVMCIRKTGNNKILPMLCTAVMRKHVTIVILHLLSIWSEQSSNAFITANSIAGVYTEYLDSICEKDDAAQIVSFLNILGIETIHTQTVVLYISHHTITDNVWSHVLKSLIYR